MKTKDIQRMLTGRNPDDGFRTISAAKQKELLKKTQADRASIERQQEEVQLNKPVFHALRQAVNQLRFADIVQDDKPAISKFDAFQAAKSAASSTNRRDPELSGFVASMENLWQRDPAGVFTAGQVAQYRETYKKVRANSSVVEVIDRVFPKYGFNTLDTRKLSQMASEIENQNDFNILMKEAGLAGNRPEQIRARAFVMEQLNRKEAQQDWEIGSVHSVEDLYSWVNQDENLGITQQVGEGGNILLTVFDMITNENLMQFQADVSMQKGLSYSDKVKKVSKKIAQGDSDVELFEAVKWLQEGYTPGETIQKLVDGGMGYSSAEIRVSEALNTIEELKMGSNRKAQEDSIEDDEIINKVLEAVSEGLSDEEIGEVLGISVDVVYEIKQMGNREASKKKAQGDRDVEMYAAIKWLREGVTIDNVIENLIGMGVEYLNAERIVSDALDNIEGKMGNREGQLAPASPLPIAPPPPTPMPTPTAPVAAPTSQPAPTVMAPVASEDAEGDDKKKGESWYRRSQYGIPSQPPDKIPDVSVSPNGGGRLPDIPTSPSDDFRTPPDKSPELPQPPEAVPLRGYRIMEAIKTGVGVVAYNVRKPNGQVIVVPASVIEKMAKKKKAQDIMEPGANEQQPDEVPENADYDLGPDSSTVDTEQLEADEINEQAEGDQVSLEPHIALLVVEAKQIASKKKMGIEKAAEQAIEKTFINAPIHIKAKYWDIICKESQHISDEILSDGTSVEQFIENNPEKTNELATALVNDDYNESVRITNELGLSTFDAAAVSRALSLKRLTGNLKNSQSVLNPDTSTNDPVELEPSKKPKPQLDPNKQNGVSFAETGVELDSESGRGMSDLPSVVIEPSSKLGGKNSNFFRSGGEDFRVGDPSLDEAGNPLAIGDQVDWVGIGGEVVEFPMHGLVAVDFPEGQLRQIGVDQPSPIRIPSDELVKVGNRKKAQYEIEQQIIQMVNDGKDAIEIGVEFGLDPNEVAEIIQDHFERSAQTSTGGGELPPPEGTDVSGRKDDEEEDDEDIEDVFMKEESLRQFTHMGENLDDHLIQRLNHTVKNRVGKGRHTIKEAIGGKKITAQFTGAELADYVAEETGTDFGELHEFIEGVAPLELYIELDELSKGGYAEEMVDLFMKNFQHWKSASRKRAYEIGDVVKWTGIGGKEHGGVVDSIDEDILWVKDESGSKAMVPQEQIEVTGRKNPWMGKRAQVYIQLEDDIEQQIIQLFESGENIEGIARGLGLWDWEVVNVIEEFVAKGEKRKAQTGREYPERQPAKGNMKFTHSKGHREGNRWVIDVGWSFEQMKGMSEGNVFAQIKTAIQMWGSSEEDFDWGDPADIQIESVDLEAGKAIVSFVSWQINNAVPATVVMSEDELVSPGGDRQRSIPGRV